MTPSVLGLLLPQWVEHAPKSEEPMDTRHLMGSDLHA